MRTQILSITAVLCCVSAPVLAAEIVDQSQTMVDPPRGYWGIGGDSEQKLAQTFTAGETADLVAIRMPIIGCAGGELVIEVRQAAADGSPTGALLNTTRIDPATVPVSGSALHEFRLSAPVRQRRNAVYAFTLRMDPAASTSNCNYAESPLGNLYSYGSLFFDVRPNPPGWLDSKEFPADPQDLAFETIIESDSIPPAPPPRASGDCFIGPAGSGFSIPIPDFVPVCRCLQDEGLREFRCAFIHPDFFAIRRIPWPIPLNQNYAETWEVLPMTKLDGAIRIDLKGANISKPIGLTFAGQQMKALEMQKAILRAPKQASDLPASATLIYGNEAYELDRSIPADGFAGGGLKGKLQDLKKLKRP